MKLKKMQNYCLKHFNVKKEIAKKSCRLFRLLPFLFFPFFFIVLFFPFFFLTHAFSPPTCFSANESNQAMP